MRGKRRIGHDLGSLLGVEVEVCLGGHAELGERRAHVVHVLDRLNEAVVQFHYTHAAQNNALALESRAAARKADHSTRVTDAAVVHGISDVSLDVPEGALEDLVGQATDLGAS